MRRDTVGKGSSLRAHAACAVARRSLTVCALLMVLALSGCASLPPAAHGTDSHALSDVSATRLGRTAAAATGHAERSGLSGFELLPIPYFAMETRLELAAEAEKTLDVQYYLLQQDATGKVLMRALRDAAGRGVRVRILVDDLYTEGEDDLFLGLAAFPNVEVRLFNPFVGGRSTFITRMISPGNAFSRIDHRMHNKLFIADNSIAVAGGRNMADEYFMRAEDNNFVDIDVLAAGPVVRDLSGAFDRYWNSAFAFPIASIATSPRGQAESQSFFNAAVDHVPPAPVDTSAPERLRRYTRAPDELRSNHLDLIQANATAVADPVEKAAGANEGSRQGTVKELVANRMHEAQQEVFVMTPYFIPGDFGLGVMERLRAQGVSLKLLTNSLASTDEPLVHAGYLRYRVPMLQSGVEIYELSPSLSKKTHRLGRFGSSQGRLHAKIAVVDQRWTFLGSMNLDLRSERKNTELGIMIDSAPFAQELLGMIDFRSSCYQLELAPDHETIQWVSREGGVEQIYSDEPEAEPLLKWEVRLLSTFVSEDEL